MAEGTIDSYGNQQINVTNSQLPVQVLATPVLDWLTMYAQHTGNDTVNLPYGASSPENISAIATTTKYILTRRLNPSDLAGVVTAVSGATSAMSGIAVIDRLRFFLDENFVNDLLIAGTCRARTSISLVTNNVSGTAYLDGATISLRKLTGTTASSTLGTKTIALNISNSTTSVIQYSVMANFQISPEVTVTPSEKLFLEVSVSGRISVSTYVATFVLLINPGTSSTYVELGV